MENNLQIGVVLKKKENIYTPEKTIYGYFKEEEKKFVQKSKASSISLWKNDKLKITLNMTLFLRKKIMQLHLFLMLKFC